MYRLNLPDISVGLSWFIMGLGKKVLLADSFAPTADAAFSSGQPLGAILAWRGVLCYALQLYFDFSGYSDMALGLARMFSIEFPLNFSSPYKATNIIDFWQRWHITLTQYITTYVYSPLQFWISARRQAQGKKVSRKALLTREGFLSMLAFPMILTMFIAGLWHGAGFQYIVYGLLHGGYLTANHGWRLFRTKGPRGAVTKPGGRASRALTHCASVLLTFLCVLVAQVFFRAHSSGHAISILASMVGRHWHRGSSLFPRETGAKAALDVAEMALGFVIVWGLPNTQQILGRFKPSLQVTPWDKEASGMGLIWRPRLGWAFALGTVFFISIVHLQDPSTFLYFQF